MLRTYLVSPPFGNYRLFHFPGADRIAGSFTLQPRPGRFGAILRTVRPIPGGWVNRIGLRNAGLAAQLQIRWDVIYSLAAIDRDDWSLMADYLRRLLDAKRRAIRIELNLSCPNVTEVGIHPREIREFTDSTSQFAVVIAKITPERDRALWQAEIALGAGVDHLHIGNAYPSPAGGISGRPLLAITPQVVEDVARRWPNASIIAGGGISRPEHVQTYRDAGARRFAIGVGCLHYWRVKRLIASPAPAGELATEDARLG